MRARKVDANQDAIVKAFERHGCVVHRTNADWDLTVQLATLTALVEVKNPDTGYGKKGLNPRQKAMPLHRWAVSSDRDVAQCVESLKTLQRGLAVL